jgi:hypothetical protein
MTIGSVSSSSMTLYEMRQRRAAPETSDQEKAQTKADTNRNKPTADSEASSPSAQLDTRQQEQIRRLKETDQRVRTHEAAHRSAGGGLVRGGSFSMTVGPDGRSYAVGGEVSIDTSPGKTPEETQQKAQLIRAAALAPSDPSPQDRSVAASASQMAAEAQSEISQKSRAPEKDSSPSDETKDKTASTAEAKPTPPEDDQREPDRVAAKMNRRFQPDREPMSFRFSYSA